MFLSKAQRQIEEDEINMLKDKKSFLVKYFIMNPKTSKVYMVWEILWFFVIVTDFALIPYT